MSIKCTYEELRMQRITWMLVRFGSFVGTVTVNSVGAARHIRHRQNNSSFTHVMFAQHAISGIGRIMAQTMTAANAGLFVCLFVCFVCSVCLFVLFVCLFIYFVCFACLFVCFLSVFCLLVCLFVFLFVCLFDLFVCFVFFCWFVLFVCLFYLIFFFFFFFSSNINELILHLSPFSGIIVHVHFAIFSTVFDYPSSVSIFHLSLFADCWWIVLVPAFGFCDEICVDALISIRFLRVKTLCVFY